MIAAEAAPYAASTRRGILTSISRSGDGGRRRRIGREGGHYPPVGALAHPEAADELGEPVGEPLELLGRGAGLLGRGDRLGEHLRELAEAPRRLLGPGLLLLGHHRDLAGRLGRVLGELAALL